MPAPAVPALISVPELPADSAVLALATVAALTVVVAAASVLAWQALSARAGGARRRSARLDELEADLHVSFARVRGAARALSGSAERALWALPGFDKRIAAARVTLAAERAMLEQLRGDDGVAMRATFARARGTLSLMRAARELRRTIWG